MKKLCVLSCVLLLAISLLAQGGIKKEDVSDKYQKSEVNVFAEEAAKLSAEDANEPNEPEEPEEPEEPDEPDEPNEPNEPSEEN